MWHLFLQRWAPSAITDAEDCINKNPDGITATENAAGAVRDKQYILNT